MYEKNILSGKSKEKISDKRDRHRRSLLYLGELEIFKFQAVANVDAEGQQGNGDLGNNAAGIVFDIGIVSAHIYDGTVHVSSV